MEMLALTARLLLECTMWYGRVRLIEAKCSTGRSFPPHFNRDSINIDSEHYSVDRNNFSLFIHDVTSEDGAHDYYM